MSLRFIIVAFLFCSSVYAKFAVINMQQIQDEAIVAKDLKLKIEKASKSLQEDFEKSKAEMEKKVADFQKIVSTLSADNVKTKQIELQKEFASAEGRIQKRDRDLQEKKLLALEEINSKIKDIAKTIAKKQDIDLVFADTLIIYYNQSSDINITKSVIKALNKEMKKSSF